MGGTPKSKSYHEHTSQAHVVKIEVFSGGGSLGCNTLYQLGKLGITNAVILEKDKLTAGMYSFT